MKYFVNIAQKDKGSNFYYSSSGIRLVADNMVIATKAIECILASADPRFDTKCAIEPYFEEEEEEKDEELSAPQG